MDKIANDDDKKNMRPASIIYEEHVRILETLRQKRKIRYHDNMASIFSKAM